MTTSDQTFTSAGTTLVGSLLAPDGGSNDGPGPVVLLISGSGQLDRDSNTKRQAIDVMKQVADHLAHNGIASFRYDKRGVGASGGDYHSAGFHDNVADAQAAVTMLRTLPKVDREKIFVLGHSEGALIATELAAADPQLAGAVLLAGTAVDGEAVLLRQIELVKDALPKPVKLLLRLLRKDIATSQKKRMAKLRASTTDTIRMQLVKVNAKWFREFMAHHPGPSLSATTIPVLAITGAKDVQVDPGDVDRICELVQSPCSGHVPQDLTHLLRTDPGPPTVRTYKKQIKRPLDPELLTRCSDWLTERVEETQGAST